MSKGNPVLQVRLNHDIWSQLQEELAGLSPDQRDAGLSGLVRQIVTDHLAQRQSTDKPPGRRGRGCRKD